MKWQNVHEHDHQYDKKGGLGNIAHEVWQIVHELCSPQSLKRGFGEHSSRTLVRCSRLVFTIKS